MKYKEKVLLDAQETSTSGTAYGVEGYRNIGIQLKAANITSGTGKFTFYGTIDGTNFVGLNVIVENIANAAAEGPTRVATKTLSANGGALVFLEPTVALKAIRVGVTIATDGSYSAYLIVKE